MTIEIPDQCECEEDFVCTKCTWDTACAIVEAAMAFNKIAKETLP